MIRFLNKKKNNKNFFEYAIRRKRISLGRVGRQICQRKNPIDPIYK